MTVYVTSQDVLKLLLDLKIDQRRLEPADVDDVIEELEALVNGILVAQEYSPVPVTTAGAIKMLAGPLRKKAAVDVYLTLYQPQVSPDWCKTWDMDWEAFITALRKGQIRLPDTDPSATQDQEVVLRAMRIMPALPEE